MLSRNRTALESTGSRVEIVAKAVSRAQRPLRLAAASGTAKVSNGEHSAEVEAEQLDALVDRYCGGEPIDLVKCDVDGCDAEALLSGLHLIEKYLPVLYFECDLKGVASDDFIELFEKLFDLGYSIQSYDNFGVPLIHLRSSNDLADVLTYILYSLEINKLNPFYYIDCLAYQPSSTLGRSIAETYRQLVESLARSSDDA
jgi:FkbM family methyltransferase